MLQSLRSQGDGDHLATEQQHLKISKRIYLGMYLEKKDACTPVSLAVLFTIGKTWKQPKCHQ